MSHYASADQVHLSQEKIYGNLLSHSPPCQAADGVVDQDACAGIAAAAAVSDIVQNFAPTPAFLQLSSTPATIMILCFKYFAIMNILHHHLMTLHERILDTRAQSK
jgi:hypothetical protein